MRSEKRLVRVRSPLLNEPPRRREAYGNLLQRIRLGRRRANGRELDRRGVRARSARGGPDDAAARNAGARRLLFRSAAAPGWRKALQDQTGWNVEVYGLV